MSKFIRTQLKNRSLAFKLIAATVIVAGIGLGGCYAYGKIKDVKAEKAALKLEQERIEEEKRIEAEKAARAEYIKSNNIAYLTFDDGPHATNTVEVLKVLKENNVKATFFVVGDMVAKNPDLVKKIKEDGHTIANHTTQHKYFYATADEFLNDIMDTDAKISEALGEEHKSLFVRVPGGSMGKTLEKSVLADNGYIDTNWTALNGDSEKGGKVSSEYILQRIDNTVGDNQYEVVLMHDIKSITASNLQAVIDLIKEKGYVFEALDEDSPISFN